MTVVLGPQIVLITRGVVVLKVPCLLDSPCSVVRNFDEKKVVEYRYEGFWQLRGEGYYLVYFKVSGILLHLVW